MTSPWSPQAQLQAAPAWPPAQPAWAPPVPAAAPAPPVGQPVPGAEAHRATVQAQLAAARSVPPPQLNTPRAALAVELPPVAPAPRSRRALGPLRLPQLLCWQLAVVAVVAALGQPWPVFTAVVLAGLAVLVLTAVRWRGRWL
ncbi:MAG: hypothetical protein HOY78_45700, partial [Saccharothrix sp.]|nr:hypothetical protein [Saccharothrix sp.]